MGWETVVAHVSLATQVHFYDTQAAHFSPRTSPILCARETMQMQNPFAATRLIPLPSPLSSSLPWDRDINAVSRFYALRSTTKWIHLYPHYLCGLNVVNKCNEAYIYHSLKHNIAVLSVGRNYYISPSFFSPPRLSLWCTRRGVELNTRSARANKQMPSLIYRLMAEAR